MEQTKGHIATIGMFDGVHRGHQALICGVKDYAREHGLRAMAVTFHPHPMAVVCPGKEPKLLTDYSERRVLLERALNGEGDVVELVFDEELRKLRAEQFMEMLRDKYGVRVLVMGYNHSFGADRIKDFEAYRRIGAGLGIKVLHGEQMRDKDIELQVSSSTIRQRLSEGDLVTANRLLGRCYALRGTVVCGRRVGRTIGFPTANLAVDRKMLIPAAGVYAATTTIDTRTYAVMVNIGTCPTVSDCGVQSIEANIIGWSGDLYDKTITIELVKRLRSEQQFDSLEALSAQLHADQIATLREVTIAQ